MADTVQKSQRRHGLESVIGSLPGSESSGSMQLHVSAPRTQINLRGDASKETFVAAVAAVLEQALPLTANTCTSAAQRIYWLGPNEWLICSESADAHTLLKKLHAALAGEVYALTDVSAGQVRLQLSGDAARHVLARGCTLDFDPAVFGPGQCAQSGLAKATVLIALHDDTPCFEIMVRRSFADYVLRWLNHAGREYGLKVQEMPLE